MNVLKRTQKIPPDCAIHSPMKDQSYKGFLACLLVSNKLCTNMGLAVLDMSVLSVFGVTYACILMADLSSLILELVSH